MTAEFIAFIACMHACTIHTMTDSNSMYAKRKLRMQKGIITLYFHFLYLVWSISNWGMVTVWVHNYTTMDLWHTQQQCYHYRNSGTYTWLGPPWWIMLNPHLLFFSPHSLIVLVISLIIFWSKFGHHVAIIIIVKILGLPKMDCLKLKKTLSAAAEDGWTSNISLNAVVAQLGRSSWCNFHHAIGSINFD